jgi:hypothetical protein
MTWKYRYFSNSRIARFGPPLVITSLLAGVAVVGAPINLSIPLQPRPLWQLAAQLEKAYKWRVTYEEAPLENSGDLVNDATTGIHWIARPTALQASFEEPQDSRSMEEKWNALAPSVDTNS